MSKPETVEVVVRDVSVKVVPELADLARSVLEYEVDLIDVYLEDEKETLVFVLPNSDAALALVDGVMTGDPVRGKSIFVDESVMGTISIDYDQEENEAIPLVFLDVPASAAGVVSSSLKTAAEALRSVDVVDVETGDPVDRSRVDKHPWDGSFLEVISGIDDVGPGHRVKVLFHNGCPAHLVERMWVEVVARDGEKLSGRLESSPVGISDLGRGDVVHFRTSNVCEVSPPHTPPSLAN